MKRNMGNIEILMDRGESPIHFAQRFDEQMPMISLVDGPVPYIWVGGLQGPCYATLEDKELLIKLAHAILTALNSA